MPRTVRSELRLARRTALDRAVVSAGSAVTSAPVGEPTTNERFRKRTSLFREFGAAPALLELVEIARRASSWSGVTRYEVRSRTGFRPGRPATSPLPSAAWV